MSILAPFDHPELNMPEVRASSYTDAILAAIRSGADGTEAALDSLAVVEVAAGLWARAFASAKVMPETSATAALTPDVLAAIGRSLALHGEYLGELQIIDGRLRVIESCVWDVAGDVGAWVYRADFPVPSGTVTRVLDGSRVVHPRIGSERGRPWAGVSPMRRALTSLQLAGRLERSLSYEVNGPVGHVIPIPPDPNAAAMQESIAGLKGKTALVETTATGFKSGLSGQEAPKSDWVARRIGPAPTAEEVMLREQVNVTLLAAAGIPTSLITRADGTALREGWREFLHATIAPVGKVIAGELSEKLDAPVMFDFADLQASDISGRARAFGSLVQGGMAIEEAARISGVLNQEAE